VVAAGSLYERDDERGLAHFVEHLVFQGTKSHPGDTLAKELQRLGLGSGPDNVAFTSYDSTIFHLELPNTEDAVLRRCLQALREYVSEATFDPDAIARERGVVLSESATRAVSGFFANNANTAFLWPHSLRADRAPIGLDATIRNCTRRQLVAFYKSLVPAGAPGLIVVGEVPPALAENLILEVFGPLTPRARPRAEPADLIPTKASQPNVMVYSDPSQSGVGYLFEHPEPFPRRPTPASAALRRYVAASRSPCSRTGSKNTPPELPARSSTRRRWWITPSRDGGPPSHGGRPARQLAGDCRGARTGTPAGVRARLYGG